MNLSSQLYEAYVSPVSVLPWYTTRESWSVALVHRSITVSAPEGHHEECLVAQLDHRKSSSSVGFMQADDISCECWVLGLSIWSTLLLFSEVEGKILEERLESGGTSLAFLRLERGSQNEISIVNKVRWWKDKQSNFALALYGNLT